MPPQCLCHRSAAGYLLHTVEARFLSPHRLRCRAAREVFDDTDTNGDGHLDEDELVSVLKDLYTNLDKKVPSRCACHSHYTQCSHAAATLASPCHRAHDHCTSPQIRSQHR